MWKESGGVEGGVNAVEEVGVEGKWRGRCEV